MLKHVMTAAFAVLAAAGSGCCAFSDRHLAFKEAQDYWVGSKLESHHRDLEKAASSKHALANGDLEYLFEETSCRFAVVIEPQSHLVRGWRYLSDPSACEARTCTAW